MVSYLLWWPVSNTVRLMFILAAFKSEKLNELWQYKRYQCKTMPTYPRPQGNLVCPVSLSSISNTPPNTEEAPNKTLATWKNNWNWITEFVVIRILKIDVCWNNYKQFIGDAILFSLRSLHYHCIIVIRFIDFSSAVKNNFWVHSASFGSSTNCPCSLPYCPRHTCFEVFEPALFIAL